MGEKNQKQSKVYGIAMKLVFLIGGLVFFSALCLGGLGIWFLRQSMDGTMSSYEETMNNGYTREIMSEVETSIAVIQGFYDRSQEGSITEEMAKEQAKEAVRSMRYREDGSGYMWIDDTDYNLVMHPILPEQEGTNRYDLTDQDGVKIIQSIMNTVNESGSGFNEFQFTKADGVTVAPKVAYSEIFEPWNWVVTTGNYVDDMTAEIQETEKGIQGDFLKKIYIYAFIIIGILVLSIVLTFMVASKVVGGIHAVEDKLKKVAEGDLSFTLDSKLLSKRDEVGHIAGFLEQVRKALSEIIGSVSHSSDQLSESSGHFRERFSDIRQDIQETNMMLEELAQGVASQATETEVVNEKVQELENVINIEKDAMGKLEASVASMVNYSTSASDSIESLYGIAQTTSGAIGIVSEQTEKTNESAKNINKAVELIKGIAEQTNLLSLNASIEAARAGEAGRGFAVVAEEIRGLAEESAGSAKEIEDIVQGLTANIDVSTQKMREVRENVKEQQKQLEETRSAFTNLHGEITQVGDVTGEIGTQTEILDQLKNTVAESVNNLVNVAETSAASTEETSARMQRLSQSVEECVEDTVKLVELSREQEKETAKFTL